ncbi:MAG: type I-B CRISPR-associated protein Cas7/Cst2/DevR [Fimbriimonadales bacterium]
MSKAITMTYLVKVSAANVNASHTEGNVQTIKRVTLPDGSVLPYISGQAVRRMLRDRLADLGWTLSEPFAKVSGQEVTPPVEPDKYIDEDLFGYMDASGGKRRTSPTRVSALVGLFPYGGDRDLGTRAFERFTDAPPQAGGNMFETELYHNLFRATMLVEMDRVGNISENELGKGKSPILLPVEQRRERLKALVQALSVLWGGGRTARMLTDLAPRFMVYARLTVKTPLFLEAVQAVYQQGSYYLRTEPILHAVQRVPNEWRKVVLVGYEPGFFANEAEFRDALSRTSTVMPMAELTPAILKDIEEGMQ